MTENKFYSLLTKLPTLDIIWYRHRSMVGQVALNHTTASSILRAGVLGGEGRKDSTNLLVRGTPANN